MKISKETFGFFLGLIFVIGGLSLAYLDFGSIVVDLSYIFITIGVGIKLILK